MREVMTKSGLSNSARWMLVFLATVIVISHWKMASASYSVHLSNLKAAGFLLSTLTARGELFLSLAGQMLVIASLYVIALAITVLLGRERIPPRHWIEKDVVLVPIVFAALSWLTLRIHSLDFPNSIWTWMLQPVFARSAAYALDAIAGVLLLWRAWTLLAYVFAKAPHLGSQISVISASTLLVVIALVGIASIGVFTDVIGESKLSRSSGTAGPNVVIIGLDSLQRDVLLSVTAEQMPNLVSLREKSFINGNVISPVARTFPAWVTILTGLHPTKSGARENHASQDDINRDASIAWSFKKEGYQTTYATDETRFSHIGAEFGFDTVIGPQKGVTDFVLGQFADFPLVNFFIQIPYSELLLPALAGNRAFAHAYFPDRFVGLMERGLPPKKSNPSFAAIHLCTAHWPFFVGDGIQRRPTVLAQGHAYFRMLKLLDRQLGKTLQMLKASGYLDEKTVLVVLADHGEDFLGHTRPETEFHGVDLDSIFLPGGHGNTLLSRKQWQVFTMVSGHSSVGEIRPGISFDLTSLEDMAPMIVELAGIQGEASSVAGTPVAEPAKMRRRNHVLMETGWRPVGLDLSNPDRKAALRIAESSYNVMADGRIEMKEKAYSEAISYKDIGVTDGKHSLVTMGVNGVPLLVSADHDQNTQQVYSLNSLQALPEGLPLAAAACQEQEIRRRIATLCDKR